MRRHLSDADRAAGQSGVRAEADDLHPLLGRLLEERPGGIAREDSRVDLDPGLGRDPGRALEDGLHLALDVGLMRPGGVDDDDDLEGRTRDRRQTRGLEHRLVRARGAVDPRQDPRETAFAPRQLRTFGTIDVQGSGSSVDAAVSSVR